MFDSCGNGRTYANPLPQIALSDYDIETTATLRGFFDILYHKDPEPTKEYVAGLEALIKFAEKYECAGQLHSISLLLRS